MVALGLEHADAMVGWMSDPVVSQGIGLSHEVDRDSTTEWIARATADPTVDALAILVDDRHVGNVVIDQVDSHLKTGRVSIYIGERDARGQGVARRALELALERARERSLYKLWLIVHARNDTALALYESVGFAREGVLQGEFLFDGRRTDAIRMGLVLSDSQ